MSFLLKEPSTFINIKLTDIGRRQLSLGQLTFNRAKFSDRELNYRIAGGNEFAYNIANNRILVPHDVEPTFSNFDGSDAIILDAKGVTSAKQLSTATTLTAGFFTGTTDNFAIDSTKLLGKNIISYSVMPPSGGTDITLNTSASYYFPNVGDLMFVEWKPIQNSGISFDSSTKINSGNPTNNLWYKIVSASTPSIKVDRPIPNFGTTPISYSAHTYFYPYNGIETYYGSASTVDAKVFNMNIVRTSSVEGTDLSTSGYTSYGSIEFNGAKFYLGFSAETPAIGIIHYTNEFSGNTYAEQLIEQSTIISLPEIMWHNISGDNGKTKNFGLILHDIDGNTISDSISNTTYRFLKDGTSSTSQIVGRVYHKLKLFVITDQELLVAMTYKSNRNYTLPPLNLSLTSSPKFPLTLTQTTGLTDNDHTYFVTYIAESFSASTPNISYGYPPALHCANIQQIDGQSDKNGNTQFLSAAFPTNSFPYLRSSANMSGGTGWNANSIQLLVNEQLKSSNYQIGSVPVSGWKRVSNVTGNGIYTGDTGDKSIDPLKLNGVNFIISRNDLNSGSTYTLNTGFTSNMNGLTFGQESFLFGNVDVNILATTFKSVITVFAKNDEFNTSNNKSFNALLDSNTYITEIGIFDNSNNLVAVGKPTFPISKSEGRYLGFQLELDF